ncbi:MAG TPA: hypothetical protein VHU92_18455 [Streptosporangiaceae bacterium]|nr:hypothetical protein [Streptosporangiaceae bacterium]
MSRELAGRVLYDDPAFFARYQDLRMAGDGLNEDLEQPALAALLPDLRGAHVLELGCGDGALAQHLRRPPLLIVAARKPC